jgi:hypothetical protein
MKHPIIRLFCACEILWNTTKAASKKEEDKMQIHVNLKALSRPL